VEPFWALLMVIIVANSISIHCQWRFYVVEDRDAGYSKEGSNWEGEIEF
jgi:hypothetical protein